jgi:hypothetical protein
MTGSVRRYHTLSTVDNVEMARLSVSEKRDGEDGRGRGGDGEGGRDLFASMYKTSGQILSAALLSPRSFSSTPSSPPAPSSSSQPSPTSPRNGSLSPRPGRVEGGDSGDGRGCLSEYEWEESYIPLVILLLEFFFPNDP